VSEFKNGICYDIVGETCPKHMITKKKDRLSAMGDTLVFCIVGADYLGNEWCDEQVQEIELILPEPLIHRSRHRAAQVMEMLQVLAEHPPSEEVAPEN